MKRVWKCDFCTHSNILSDEVELHEKKCSFNPIFKNCWSCKFHRPGYEGDYNCDKDLMNWDFEDAGNCSEWVTDDKKLIRKLKLEQLKTINL